MRIQILLILLLIPVSTTFADSQILSTDVGTLDVKVFTLDKPSTGDTNLNVDFINSMMDRIQQHVDYTVSVTKDGQSIFETPALTHSSKGTVSIPVDFPESGMYNVDVTIQGILFNPISTEKVSFVIPVTLKDPVAQPYIAVICHKDSPIRISSTIIPEHLAHGDTEGECTVDSKNTEQVPVTTPILLEPEIIQTKQIDSQAPTPQVIIENEILEESLVYVNEEYSFSYTPPKDWVLDSDEGDVYLKATFVPNEEHDPIHAIWILALSLGSPDISNSSDEKILKDHRAFMNENIGSQLSYFEIIKQDFQRYGNAVKLTYELDTQVNYENQLLSKKSLWVSWVFDSGEMINIVYSSKQGQYLKYLDDFTTSLDTFYVKPQLGQINTGIQSQMSDAEINRLLGTSFDNPEASLVDLIINVMDPIFDLVFNIQDNERLQQWGYEIIQRQVGTTENQIIGQLGYDPRVTCC